MKIVLVGLRCFGLTPEWDIFLVIYCGLVIFGIEAMGICSDKSASLGE